MPLNLHLPMFLLFLSSYYNTSEEFPPILRLPFFKQVKLFNHEKERNVFLFSFFSNRLLYILCQGNFSL